MQFLSTGRSLPPTLRWEKKVTRGTSRRRPPTTMHVVLLKRVTAAAVIWKVNSDRRDAPGPVFSRTAHSQKFSLWILRKTILRNTIKYTDHVRFVCWYRCCEDACESFTYDIQWAYRNMRWTTTISFCDSSRLIQLIEFRPEALPEDFGKTYHRNALIGHTWSSVHNWFHFKIISSRRSSLVLCADFRAWKFCRFCRVNDGHSVLLTNRLRLLTWSFSNCWFLDV